jgi:hypothetical protein
MSCAFTSAIPLPKPYSHLLFQFVVLVEVICFGLAVCMIVKRRSVY